MQIALIINLMLAWVRHLDIDETELDVEISEDCNEFKVVRR